MKVKLLTLALLAGGAVFAGPRVSIGIGIGVPGDYGYYPPPPPPPVYYEEPGYAYVPPCPGPGYTWTAGSWYFAGPRRLWRPGYWVAPVYGRGYYGGGHSYYGGGGYYGGGRGYYGGGRGYYGGNSYRGHDREYRGGGYHGGGHDRGNHYGYRR